MRRTLLHHPADTVQEDLGISISTQKRTLAVYAACGDVRWRGVHLESSNACDGRRVSADDDLRLIELVRDSPTATLGEHQATLFLQDGRRVSISTLSRAMRRCALSRLRVRTSPKPTLDDSPHPRGIPRHPCCTPSTVSKRAGLQGLAYALTALGRRRGGFRRSRRTRTPRSGRT